MKMKTILIALASVAFLVGCSADGFFSGSSIESPGVEWSNNDDDKPPSGNVKCLLPSGSCMELSVSTCMDNYGTPVSSCPSTGGGQYCYNYGDCDLIGGNYIDSASDCTYEGGEIKTLAQCRSLGANIEGEDY